jgi:hypothetical protein
MYELELLVKLKNLHEMRKEMSFASIYHAHYEDMAIELNQKLRSISGKNYIDYTLKELDLAQRVIDRAVGDHI